MKEVMLIEKIKNFLFVIKNSKKYGNIIQLGYNCESAYRFYRQYKFVDSSLFGWTFVSFDELIFALSNFDKIGSDDFTFDYSNYMFKCDNTGILFHGKTPASSFSEDKKENENIILSDKEELKSRIKYLKEKFIKTANDGKLNLYIKKVSKKEVEDINFNEKINWLYQYLEKFCTNKFKLLLITEEEFYQKCLFENKNILTRYVKKYSPDEEVTNKKLGDAFGWRLIYSEFRPKYKKKNSKKLKFEEVN